MSKKRKRQHKPKCGATFVPEYLREYIKLDSPCVRDARHPHSQHITELGVHFPRSATPIDCEDPKCASLVFAEVIEEMPTLLRVRCLECGRQKEELKSEKNLQEMPRD